MANELPRPGISIIQQFRTTSPTIVQPTLVPCVVGPAFQLVEAYKQDASGNNVANTDAVISMPPVILALQAQPYVGLDGKKLKVSVNGGAAQEVTFSDPTAVNLTADQVKAQILSAAPSGWTAYTVTIGASTYVLLKGTSKGDGQTLQILDGDANTPLGFLPWWTAYGLSTYKQDKAYIDQLSFHDPRGNIDEIDFDEDSIRVFINTGSTLQEVKRTETFLRNGIMSFILGSAITFPTTTLKNTTLKLVVEMGAAEQTVSFTGEMHALDGTHVTPGNVYSAVGTNTLVIQKNNLTPVTITFATPADIAAAVTQINSQFGAPVAFRSLADGTPDGGGTYITFQVGGATPTGDHIRLIETGSTAWSAIGFTAGQGGMGDSLLYKINSSLNGTYAYDGGSNKLLLKSLKGYIKVGTGTGNTVLGLTDNTEAYVLYGVDDGNGDTKSPLIRFPSEDFGLDPTAASLTGTTTLPASTIYVHRKTFIVQLDGLPPQTITFNGGPITPANPYSSPGTNQLKLNVNGTLKTVTFATPADIAAAITAINTQCSQTVCYRSNGSGVADPAGTYISFQVGGSTDAGGIIWVDATSTAFTAIGFTGVDNIYQWLTQAELATAINATMGAGFASVVSNNLVLASTKLGDESKIEIGMGTANATLGFTDNAVVNGRAFKPKEGDALYAEGEYVGTIVQVSPGGTPTDLRIDTQQTFATFKKRSFYIQAKNIPSTLPATRPRPDLVVDLAGNVTVKQDILRDTRVLPVSLAMNPLMLTYKALRLDVTASAANPSMLTFESTTELEAAMEPITSDSPLSLGLFFALLNSPGVTVSGLGVDAVTDDAPYGTLEAYSLAAAFLESEEVYGIAPLTQEAVVHQMWQTHVNYMSEPDSRGERILVFNPPMPARKVDTLVGSGTDADSTGITNELDTKLSNLAALLLAAGVDPSGTITVEDGVYLDIASDSKKYSVSTVTGTKLTVRVTFAPGENDDNFYSMTNLPSTLISEEFSIKVRGAVVTSKQEMVETYAALGQSYADRRLVMIGPDQCGASIKGLEQLIPAFYICAAVAGMIGMQPPQQGFTNFPITGFTRVVGSNDKFSERQLNIGAAGGVYWVIQEVAGGPLTCRHQLTTDLTSIETRELSITKVVDFTAKFMRAGLRNFIGKFNITQGFLDTLSTVIQGQLAFLTEAGVLIGGDLNNIIQDKDAPDTVLIDVTLDVPYPCNYIRLTLII